MAPMTPILMRFSNLAQTNQEEALTQLAETLSGPAGSQILGMYFLGFALPFLLAPVIVLSFSRVSLGLWDGYEPGPKDLFYSFRQYIPSLSLCFHVSLYLILMTLAFIVTIFPYILLSGLAREPVSSGFLSLIGLAIGGFIFYSFFWPLFRRITCLQILPFFAFLDGQRQKRTVTRIYALLEGFPTHLNQCAAILALTVFLPALILDLSLAYLAPESALSPFVGFASRIVKDLLLLWPLIALAGFYRLVLFPPEEEIEPLARQIDLAKEDHLGEA
jgi:hypothetical protein